MDQRTASCGYFDAKKRQLPLLSALSMGNIAVYRIICFRRHLVSNPKKHSLSLCKLQLWTGCTALCARLLPNRPTVSPYWKHWSGKICSSFLWMISGTGIAIIICFLSFCGCSFGRGMRHGQRNCVSRRPNGWRRMDFWKKR